MGCRFKNPILNIHRNDTFQVIYFFIFLAIACFTFSLIMIKYSMLVNLFLIIAGLIFFTFSEYIIHRFILHIVKDHTTSEPPSNSHLYHHRFPRDKYRLDISLPVAILMAMVFIALFWLVLREKSFVFFSGFATGYCLYHFVHYKIHTVPPPKSMFKYLWKHHHVHHYMDDTVAFGVTSPFWDIIFGTMPKK